MRGLDRGERFVVTRNGVPVGELSPLRRHRFISTEFALGVLRGAPRVDFEAFRADVDEVADPNAESRA